MLRLQLLELLFYELTQNLKTVLLTEPVHNACLNQVTDEQWRLKLVAHPATRVDSLAKILRKPTRLHNLLPRRHRRVNIKRRVSQRLNSNLHRQGSQLKQRPNQRRTEVMLDLNIIPQTKVPNYLLVHLRPVGVVLLKSFNQVLVEHHNATLERGLEVVDDLETVLELLHVAVVDHVDVDALGVFSELLADGELRVVGEGD